MKYLILNKRHKRKCVYVNKVKKRRPVADNFIKQLNKLKPLNLPKNKFAIFGSGPIVIRGFREARDIDIIVKKELWDELKKKYAKFIKNNPECIKIDNIEIYKDWPGFDEVNQLIDEAEIIGGWPFVKLKYVLIWKKRIRREKDIKDIELIKKYYKGLF